MTTEQQCEAATANVDLRPGYEALFWALVAAYEQAADGKGANRHGAEGVPFEEQPIFWIPEEFGEGFLLGQAVKKLHESRRLDVDAAVTELRGAIVYIAAQIMRLEDMR